MTRTKKNAPPDLDSPRVRRGGGWVNTVPAWVCAMESRNTEAPVDRDVYLGFRCALRGREPLKVTP